MARVVKSASCLWIPGAPERRAVAPQWLQAMPADRTPCCPWRDAVPGDRPSVATWLVARRSARAGTLGWLIAGYRLQPLAWSPWGLARCADTSAISLTPINPRLWRGPYLFAPWVLSHVRDAETQSPSNSAPVPLAVQDWLPWGLSRSASCADWLPWGMGIRISQGVIIITPPPDPDEPDPSTHIPIQDVYIVINNVTLLLLPGNTPVNAYSLSLRWDMSSWSVGWSASLPGSYLSSILPATPGAPVELLATINGTSVRLLAESISRDRRFGDSRLSVSGRGRLAWLADPYDAAESRTNTGALDAQQIAGQVLEINGVPLGWALDWQIPDWLVPAGVWSHQGSRVEALQRLAEAAGGYILGHRTAETIHVLPQYPALPWQWASLTPDYVIPPNVATVESIAWSERPAYNAIYVSGQQQGVLRRVLRQGTAGDMTAQMITDPLITADAVAGARGASVLAAGGRQATVSIRMPVFSGTGIIELGKLVSYNDGTTPYLGLVRSVQVEYTHPRAWQTLEIETHG